MEKRTAHRWIVDLVLECQVEPPREVVHEALSRLGGPGSGLTAEEGLPKPTLEVVASDAAAASRALAAKEQGLLNELRRYECKVRRRGEIQDRGSYPL